MNETQAIEKILAIPKLHLPASLDRIRTLLSRLGNPQDKLSFVHVAGTNGKGSTCTMIAEGCRADGRQVGLFTSPYINDFKERFIVNGRVVDGEEFSLFADAVFAAAGDDPYTQFEIITAIGMLIFANHACDVVVLECGLGGRFDATNVISPPLAAVVTSIGYDHMAILGDTIAAIAGEKSKIIKPDCGVAVIAPQVYADAYTTLSGEAFLQSVPLRAVKAGDIHVLREDADGLTFTYRGEEFTTALAARYQAANAATAIEALRAIGVSEGAIRKGLRRAFIPARMERLQSSPTVLIDGAHNADGMRALADSLRPCGKFDLLVGMLGDKSPATALKELLCADLPIGRVLCVTVDSPRAEDGNALARDVRALTGNQLPVTVYPRPAEALNAWLDGRAGNCLVCCGSLYMMGELRAAHKERKTVK